MQCEVVGEAVKFTVILNVAQHSAWYSIKWRLQCHPCRSQSGPASALRSSAVAYLVFFFFVFFFAVSLTSSGQSFSSVSSLTTPSSDVRLYWPLREYTSTYTSTTGGQQKQDLGQCLITLFIVGCNLKVLKTVLTVSLLSQLNNEGNQLDDQVLFPQQYPISFSLNSFSTFQFVLSSCQLNDACKLLLTGNTITPCTAEFSVL